MEINNDYLLRLYEQRVHNLDDSDETGTDEELVIITRDLVADREWSANERRKIEILDAALAHHAQQFEDIFPLVNESDRTHWWWFLHEGPQVREEAHRLAEEGKATHAIA